MREITKIISLSVDGIPYEFRLTKLDAFSGASLLRLLKQKMLTPSGNPEGEKASAEAWVDRVFVSLTDAELRSLMISCLNHTEVRLDAGWQPVMTREEWGWPELAYDAGSCIRLTLQGILWTLQGFFGGSGLTSRPAGPRS